jgi:DNA ligase-1
MKRFTELFCELDRTTRTNEKVAALARYFREAPAVDAAWALQFLCGRTLPRAVSSKNLWNWVVDITGVPPWLLGECHDTVGDAAETIALLLPKVETGTMMSLSRLVEERLLPLGKLPEGAKRDLLMRTWRELSPNQLLVWNKLITGEFRVGVARTLVIRALAGVAGVEAAVMAHRVLGKWQPTAEGFKGLLASEGQEGQRAQPYPFFLASPLEMKIKQGESLEALGNLSEWQVEWKWDGIRAQLIRRGGETLIWSRGDDMVTDSFPEIAEAGGALPDGTVLDGEILAWQGEQPLPFGALQRRLGRKVVSAKTRKDFPIAFVAYDLLEAGGVDVRSRPLSERRARLAGLVSEAAENTPASVEKSDGGDFLPGFGVSMQTTKGNPGSMLRLSPIVTAASWAELEALRQQARDRGVEGLMLKRIASSYGAGRQRGDWWKWKIDPFVIDAVLVSAQPGHGRRATLYTDYTFAVWDNGQLVPIAKAYSGLTDEEILQVDRFVRENTIEKFGPVRSVKPEQVFELAFEGIQSSDRHKSGVAVRFPRMNRWRHDKKPEDADTLEDLRRLAENGVEKSQAPNPKSK